MSELSMVRKVAIIGRYETPDLVNPILSMTAVLEENGYEVVFNRDTAKQIGMSERYVPLPHLLSDEGRTIGMEADVAVVIGGDGTMLGFAREVAACGLPLIGVNRGRVGFITDIPLADANEAVLKILGGEYVAEDRAMLDMRVFREGSVKYQSCALNDVTVTRGGISGMVELSVKVDGQFMFQQRMDGLIISTPTGSTAYSLASGGPILHPRLRSVVITPVAPQNLSNRPIVLPGDSQIEIELLDGRNINAHSDMQTYTELRVGDIVRVTRSPHAATFIHPVGHDHYATLRQKLHWNE